MLYHKNVNIPQNVKCNVLSIINNFKYNPLTFSNHAREELKKENNPLDIAKTLYSYSFEYSEVFEVYTEGERVEKIGFRIGFSTRDIVFIISKDKNIITLWTNDKNDIHATLNKEVYSMA